MKTRLAAVFAIMFLLLMGIVQGAAAQTGCFPDTNGHWAETFICWLKDNGIVSGYGDGTYRPENQVTRGEMAVYAKNVANYSTDAAQTMADTAEANAIAEAEALVDVPPRTGYIMVSGGQGDWFPESPPAGSNIYMYHNPTGLQVYRSTVGAENLGISPDMPVALYGKSLRFVGVELCYDAQEVAYLSEVEIFTVVDQNGNGTGWSEMLDPTNLTGNACSFYELPTPVMLGIESGSIYVRVLISWASAPTAVVLGRTTFVFEATDTDTAAPG